MYHSREIKKKIIHLHERSLKVVYNGKQLTFSELLTKNSSASVDERNL